MAEKPKIQFPWRITLIIEMILQLQPEREKSALLCIMPAWEIDSTLEISISINKEINTVYSE